MRFKIQIEKNLIDKLFSIKKKMFQEDANRIRNGFVCSKLLLDKNYSINAIVGVLDTFQQKNSDKMATTLNLNAEAYKKLEILSTDYKKSMADIIRAVILLNCKSDFRDMVSSEDEWNGEIIRFDPDSSPKAWVHYRKFYGDFIKKKFQFEELKFHEYLKYGNDKGKYINKPIKYYNRLQSLSKQNSDLNNAISRISGDTDFNFNDKKYDEYIQLLYGCYSGDDLENYLNLLMFCNEMHHTLVNFSIMQVMGNMQGYKSRGIKIQSKYEWLDRVDSFIYLLSQFYKIDQQNRKYTEIIKYAGCNWEVLLDYLNEFDSINDYCEKIYFINKDFTKRMIESGKLPIDTGMRVVEHMQLAIEFWSEKEKYFCKSDSSPF